jgi:hypothetical protein
MARSWEAEFMELWRAGVDTAEIAKQMGIPQGTAKSRAHTLQLQGKIEPRPRGGAYPRQKAQARQEPPPAPPAPQVPPTAPATPSTPSPPTAPAPPAVTFVAVPEIQEMLGIVKDLQARVVSLERARVPPALPAPPAPPAAERKEIQQWTVRLSKALIERLKAVAYERRIHPSQLLEELAWQALNDRHASPP